MSKKTWWRPATALLALVLASGCATGDDAVAVGGEFQFVAPGGQVRIRYDGPDRKPISGLSGPSLMEDGKTISLDDYEGKVVVVNVWGAWCPPCRTEAPEMQKVQDEAGPKGVQVLGLDVRETSINAGRDFKSNRGLTYPSIYDDSGRTLLAFKGYPPNAVPSTIVLDKQHRVAAVFLESLIASDLLPLVEELAAE
ncbi:TlpA family protein disulfide reductase [Actinosynnema pretiosum subsp. pretiosum]|uniref:Alkyl hydroperoxide reductase/ Thiol specific antioxidant/ Mal allergen n=2 Tax=Actinosynnema TaxID=40566 RepID=C6WNF0_ACTMD|nr:TlpA disulfide reductase family protein [Actinosynnema mirum]ACU40514.1 alkyl hydroperoxide reductase/ Thiol specific antioxidant/ Mal allergen [Actinosynnema mirum DSM 43827]AXX34028.1 Thiol:disulfide oxidoreductase related to ResA [Actinosynnema pretiosum subsp. pretiosum]QUF02236.1 TlpA family protein disulfide reductase [Actinosynnema pretiosum subsp. pretiosum]